MLNQVYPLEFSGDQLCLISGPIAVSKRLMRIEYLGIEIHTVSIRSPMLAKLAVKFKWFFL
jgi:hypothetical protein